MTTAAAIVYGVFMVLTVICWLTGMRNYMRLAREAKLDYFQTWFTFKVYGYAFTRARRSRETKLMVGGFVGMMAFLMAGIAASILVADLTR